MSIESAQEFINRANQDAVIRKLARERFGDIENVGREHGYDFARDEFDEAMRERRAMQAAQGQGPSGGGGRGKGDVDDSGSCQCTPAGGWRDDVNAEGSCQCTPAGRVRSDEEGGSCQCTPAGTPRR